MIPLFLQVFQHLLDVFARQLALRGQDQIEGMLGLAERRQQAFGYTLQAIGLEHVEVHFVTAWAFVN
ncbi:hypothetical protein D3C81_2224070 [compost metagenome]